MGTGVTVGEGTGVSVVNGNGVAAGIDDGLPTGSEVGVGDGLAEQAVKISTARMGRIFVFMVFPCDVV